MKKKELIFSLAVTTIPLILASCFGTPLTEDPTEESPSEALTITSVSPNSGFYLGGLVLTIIGTGFAETPPTVTLGGASCANVSRVSSSQLTCVSPAHSTGSVDVIVKNGPSESTTLSSGFTYKAFSRIATLAGTGAVGSTNGSGNVAKFSEALNGFFHSGSSLFLADGINRQIRKIDLSSLDPNSIQPSAVKVSLVAGSGVQGDADGAADAAQFQQPDSIYVVGDNLYFTDTDWNFVQTPLLRKVAASTGATSTIDSNANTYGDLAYDGSAYFYAAECGNTGHRIYKFLASNGTKTVIAGSTTSGNTDATGTSARFNVPYGVALDSSNTNLYVSDNGNHKIRKIVLSTGVVSTLAGSGTAGSTDGTGTAAKFNTPGKIQLVGDYLIVADSYNCTVRQVDVRTGVVTTLAGVAGSCASTDGELGVARLNHVAAAYYVPKYGIFTGTSTWDWDDSSHADQKVRLIH